ncbi:hypothetical protein FHX42_004164 [Saccharopolyspora lacisalsi]|uniref:FAD-dependent oxidoreductase 2 FAD-binding domain-containing protein n=1 Tax=Halosaccharopolyspora lacisalsi TaxID=1000566 RepID=A0A839E4N9_9PSEU|nr:FAD-binding dehydrogenase [Halosaccharopolyspora lacisalsi]MBA8826785.1 hypothetical protein [Halosaccharopolyspora lacisalsi]
MSLDADVVVVGAGLAGLVATAELADAGRRVILLDQEPESSLGGQAHWSFGGLFFVDSAEQRRLGIRDSRELALQDWLGSAGFDRPEDHWPRRWAEAYVGFAAGEKRAWLHERGMRFFPLVQWAERGGHHATGHGNSVPRFHVTWGTGPGVLEPFLRRVREAQRRGLVTLRSRHRVTGLTTTGAEVDGVRGEVLVPSAAGRGQPSSREVVGDFELHAQAVVVTSGGIGANHELVRRNWPRELGTPPERMLSGVPDHVDGRMLDVMSASGARVINADRMWHYTEGIANYDPVWNRHGIRILPGPSSLWVDARGNRLPAPLYPGSDTLGTLRHILSTGYDHTWFVLNRRVISREFALSGSEQNPDLTGRSVLGLLRRGGGSTPGPVAEFVRRGGDFVVRRSLPELVRGMNELTGRDLVDGAELEREVLARDRQVETGLGKDNQLAAIRQARRYAVDRRVRVAEPHPLTDPDSGPLIAVRLSVLTRKSLGGAETDLDGRVLAASGAAVPGLYAAGEVSGFGGGGVHGYRALEGTFLGGCLFSGRSAGRAAARSVA